MVAIELPPPEITRENQKFIQILFRCYVDNKKSSHTVLTFLHLTHPAHPNHRIPLLQKLTILEDPDLSIITIYYIYSALADPEGV